MPEEKGFSFQGRIYYNDSNITSIYSNHVLIKKTDNEVILSFYEVIPPDMSDPRFYKEQIQQLGGRVPFWQTNCLAKIVMTPQKAEEFLALFENRMKSGPTSKIEILKKETEKSDVKNEEDKP